MDLSGRNIKIHSRKPMKIKVPGIERLDVGGGGTFIRNIKKAIANFGDLIVNEGDDFDILLIAGASLCDREKATRAKQAGKKIILRVDNILEDCKNRNTGMPRMREFAEMADVVIYQSQWAKRLLKPYCGEGMIIYNAVDTDIFYPRKEKKNWGNLRIFYGKYSRGEGKNFNVVQYWWREYCIDKQDDMLILAGRFADELQKINHPFEFHNGENFDYKGILSEYQLAEVMRSCDVAFLPYFADACSNMILEAQACGLPVIYDCYGGTKELIESGVNINWNEKPVDMVGYAMGSKKEMHSEDWKEKWGLERMGREYSSLFKLLGTKDHEIG